MSLAALPAGQKEQVISEITGNSSRDNCMLLPPSVSRGEKSRCFFLRMPKEISRYDHFFFRQACGSKYLSCETTEHLQFQTIKKLKDATQTQSAHTGVFTHVLTKLLQNIFYYLMDII